MGMCVIVLRAKLCAKSHSWCLSMGDQQQSKRQRPRNSLGIWGEPDTIQLSYLSLYGGGVWEEREVNLLRIQEFQGNYNLPYKNSKLTS